LNVEVDDAHCLGEQAAAKRFADPRTAPGNQADPPWHCLSFVFRPKRRDVSTVTNAMSFHVWSEAGERIVAGRQPSSSGSAGGGPVVDLDRLDRVLRLEVEDETIEPQLSLQRSPDGRSTLERSA
jgi:hypothetical protein